MSTNEEDVEDETPTRAAVIQTFFGESIAKATDTGPATGISLRVWLLIVIIGAVVTLGAFPLNLIGTVALLALALTLATRVRGGPR